MKTTCVNCERLHVDTIAETEGEQMRLVGTTINDRVKSLHQQLETLLIGMNETRIFKLTDMFVKE